MNNFEKVQAAQQLAADQWLEANKSELSDFTTPEQSASQKQGYEVVDAIVLEIATEEAALAMESEEIWQGESEDTHSEFMARFDVSNLAHWKKKQEKDDSGKVVSSRFDAVKFAKHMKRVSKAKQFHDIEFVLDKAGRVRSKLVDNQVELKAAKIARKLAQLDKGAAPRLPRIRK